MSRKTHNFLASSALSLLLAACGTKSPENADRVEGKTSAELAAPLSTASASSPVVVELFQSQGCSSCPPANANLNEIAARPEVLALSFGVTYWDKLG